MNGWSCKEKGIFRVKTEKVVVVGIAFMDGVGNLVWALSIKERVQWKAWRDVYASLLIKMEHVYIVVACNFPPLGSSRY